MAYNPESILKKFIIAGADSVYNDVSRISATNKTAKSIRPTVFKEGTVWRGQIRGRKFFAAIETGRGPRQSTQYESFDTNMLEYMNARGIGADLPEKKRKQLARFLTLRINKYGDNVFQAGGRQVYSDSLRKIISEFRRAIKKDFREYVLRELKNEFNRN